MNPGFVAALRRTAVELADSKKAMTTLLGILVVVLTRLAGKFHIVLDPTEANELATHMLYLFGILVGGQAAADFGKEATPKTSTTDTTAPLSVPAGSVVTPPSTPAK